MQQPAPRLELRRVPYSDPVAQGLVTAMADEMDAIYPPHEHGPSPYPVRPEHFDAPRGLFLVATLDDRPVACGGIRPLEGASAEVKRMYTAPEVRGQGVARIVLEALEEFAREAGYGRVYLQTGPLQPHAIALYEHTGYRPVDGYPSRHPGEDEICFEKVL